MVYEHSWKWDVGASGLLGGTHISLRPPCGSRTSRTSEWAPGTPHIASAAAIVARRSRASAPRLSSLCRGRARGPAAAPTPRSPARLRVALQTPARLEALRESVLHYKPAQAIARKQKATGLWGGNLLAPTPSKAYGWTEPGTVYQYRRLLELGWPPSERVFRNADRFLFQLLSRIETDDPDRTVAQRALELLVEFQKAAKTDPGLGRWARRMGPEGAACPLARGGPSDDPRVRGTAHTIASNVSLYLRSELAA